jgi:trans-aconitate methyltransferase
VERVEIDSGIANGSRVYDYLVGGRDNFAVDREAAEQMTADLPGGLDSARSNARANRVFLGRSVRRLAGDFGIRQFLDIGTGIPTAGNTHEVAQQVAPESRIVYVDNDAMVLAHAQHLLRSTPEGATTYLHADLREPDEILGQAAETLDFRQPIALMLLAVLQMVTDDEGAHGVVTRLMKALPSGSYLAISHLTGDFMPVLMADAIARLNERVRETLVLRSRDEVARFFDGLDVLEPGVVQVDDWLRVESPPPTAKGWTNPLYVGIGRKR